MRRPLFVFTNSAEDMNESNDSFEIIFISQISIEILTSPFPGDLIILIHFKHGKIKCIFQKPLS